MGRQQVNILKFLFVLGVFCLPVFSLSAQEIEVSAPEEVLENEAFQIVYDIYSAEPVREMPELLDAKDYELLRDPSLQRSYPSPFWGRNYHTLRITYTFKAKKTGKLKLPRIGVAVDGKKIQSENGVIVVAKLPEMGKVDCFVKVLSSKNSVNEGDTLTLVYKLYSTKEISRILDINIPRGKSFYYQDLTPRRIEADTERVDGVDYKVYVIGKYRLQSRSLGTVNMPEGEVSIEYTYPTGRVKSDRWGRTYDEQLREVKKCIIEPVTIRVHNMMII